MQSLPVTGQARLQDPTEGHGMSKNPPQRAKKCRVLNNDGLSLHWTHVGGESGCTMIGSDRHGRNSHAIWRGALLVETPLAHRARLMWEWELTREHLGVLFAPFKQRIVNRDVTRRFDTPQHMQPPCGPHS